MNTLIYRSFDGAFLGIADVDPDEYTNACQNAEGHVRAEQILCDEDLERLGIEPDLTVYALCQ